MLSLGLAVPGLAGAAEPARPAAGDPLKPAAGDPVKPDLGAGPHRDRSPQTSGEGESPRQPVSPPAVLPKDKMKKRPGYKDDVPAPRASRV